MRSLLALLVLASLLAGCAAFPEGGLKLRRGGIETRLSDDAKVHVKPRSDGVFVKYTTSL